MRTWVAACCYGLADVAFRFADSILDLPPGVEARAYLGEQIAGPTSNYYDD